MTRLEYLRRFARSWEHAALAVVTLALPFAAAHPLALVLGATAYVLGWVFVGDSRWFRRKVDAAERARLGRSEDAALVRLQAERQALVRQLSAEARARYAALADVCRDIENQLAAGGLTSGAVERIDGLMWTYLSLLGSEATLDGFVRREAQEGFADKIGELEARLQQLHREMTAAEPGTREYELKLQLIASREEGLEALRRRRDQCDRATENLRLVRAEQERIAEQLKLLRADLYASTAVGQISQRVNETIDQLATSGRISDDVPPAIRELPAFKTRRVGYDLQKET